MNIRMIILVIAVLGLLGAGVVGFLYFRSGSPNRTDDVPPDFVFTGISADELAEMFAENKRRIGRIGDIEKRGARVSDVRELAFFLDPAVPLFSFPPEGYAEIEARRVLESLGDAARPELLKVVKDASLPAMLRAKTLGFLRQNADLVLFEEVLAMPDGKFISILSRHARPNVPKPDLDEFTRWFEVRKHRYVFDTKEYKFRPTYVEKNP